MNFRNVNRLFAVLAIFSVAVSAQHPTPAPPQTARQALVEMFNGGQDAVAKHLTVEVQQLLKQPENSRAAMGLAMFDSIKSQAGGELQLFETGPVLLAVNEPRQHQKFEVRIENDDLNADEDTLELSLHLLQDGQEQQDQLGYFSSRLNITMKRQQNVWRLSNIKLGFEVPVGDPEFVKQTFLESPNKTRAAGFAEVGPASGDGMVGVTPGSSDALPEGHMTIVVSKTALPPEQMIMMLGLAESSFAREHADAGFTCSLGELSGPAKEFGLEQISATSNGYKINLTGCQGKPAGSFQISLEPVSPGTGGKAYCLDATQNVRVSDDGRGETCLVSGRPQNNMQESGTIGFDPISAGAAGTPKK